MTVVVIAGQGRKHRPYVLNDIQGQVQWEYPRQKPGSRRGCGQKQGVWRVITEVLWCGIVGFWPRGGMSVGGFTWKG